jgi:hypothetical protein
VFNSAIIQRLQEERARVRAQIAELSSTLLAAHPRMLELAAQRQNIERQIRSEATRIVRGLENDAAVAAAREQQISANLDALKRNAATSNGAEVNLRALEREATAQRLLLESYLTRFREAAVARQPNWRRRVRGSSRAQPFRRKRAIPTRGSFLLWRSGHGCIDIRHGPDARIGASLCQPADLSGFWCTGHADAADARHGAGAGWAQTRAGSG